MSDEELLNDDKFENAKLRKEVAELKAVKKEIPKPEGASVIGVESDEEDSTAKASAKVKEYAWGNK